MDRRWFSVLSALLLCLCLWGCSFPGMDAQNLMSPPKAGGDQQGIHELLQGDKPSINFVYPKNGDYRSAIITQDFTGNGKEDAIGFYALEDGSVEVQFLVKSESSPSSEDNGGWRTAATFRNSAIQVDRVCFGDLNGDGATDVLIGWGSATGRTASVNAYLYEDGDVSEHTLGAYGEMAVTDFDRDGVSEVFTIDRSLPAEEEGAQPSPAQAKVYVFQDGTVRAMASAEADNSISSYVSVVFGKVTYSLWGVVVDGAKADGSMTSQVFTLAEDVLSNYPAGVNQEDYVNPFSRPSSAPFVSRDINGDGILELPLASLLPGFPENLEPDATSYLVKWTSFSTQGRYRTVLPSLWNPGENYWFRLPDRLQGAVCASNDASKRTVTYMQAVPAEDGEEMLLGAPLFSIRAFTKSAWESRGTSSGYELLTTQGDTVYGIQILSGEETLKDIAAAIKEDFKLISD